MPECGQHHETPATVWVRVANGAEVSGFRVTAGFRVFAGVGTGGFAREAPAEVVAVGLAGCVATRELLLGWAVPRRSRRSTCPARIVQGELMPLALPSSR